MKTTNRTKKIFAVFCAIVLVLCMATPAFADTNDPIAVVHPEAAIDHVENDGAWQS